MRAITVAIVNYNGIGTVLDVIRSIYEMEGVEAEVVVVDDGSTDGSPEVIRSAFPEVRMHQEAENTRAVNFLRNIALGLARTRRVLLTDNDVIFDPRCALELLRVMEADDSVAACLPRLMYLHDPSRLCFDGGKMHYLATTVAPTRDLPADCRKTQPEPAVGGGVALFDMDKLDHVGRFDEAYELAWGDDAELHQRLFLAGYKCLYAPSAVGYHEHKPFGATRRYRARGQLSNRWHFMLTHYCWRTLFVIAPALVLFELAEATYYVLMGLPLLYLQGTYDAWRRLDESLERRRSVQALRAVSDKKLLDAGPLYLRPSEGLAGAAAAAATRGLGRVFSAYWRLVQPAVGGRRHSSSKRGDSLGRSGESRATV